MTEKLIQYKIIDNPKYKLLECKRNFDCSNWTIYIDGKPHYSGASFNKNELKRRIDNLRKYFKLEEIVEEELKIKRHRRTKAEMSLLRSFQKLYKKKKIL